VAISLRAPAKINWFLSVLNRRDDGYHAIVSLMQCVDLFDTLIFEDGYQLAVISDMDGVPVEKNLVYRAAELMRAVEGSGRGARITLKKEIPLSAGLGGGSSDAAYTLTGLNRLWDMNLSAERLRELGSKIGSDVPFFIDTVYAIVEGRGEVVTPLRNTSETAVLLVNPGFPVSAGWAYHSLQSELTKKSVDIKLFCQSLDRTDYGSLRTMLVNDLETVVSDVYPEIAGIKAMLAEQGAVISAMSGSGPTVFGVFRSVEETVKASLNMKPYWCRAVKTLTG
jgi:4-diphosphocytidyl-2-C-methyl-D-erythritol kinase